MGRSDRDIITHKSIEVTMKGQIRAGNVLIAFIILGFIMLGAFTLYANFLVDNDVTPDKSLETEINSLYASSRSNAVEAQDDSEEISTQFDSGDNIFIRGSKALQSVTNTGKLATKGFAIAQNGTGETQLPQEFWDTNTLIFTIIVIFVIAGALWKWDFFN